jgi:predicted DsbA family dithiol-disulfide isomerase
MAHRLGITGVPTFIFQNKYLVSGAVDPEALLEIIDKVTALAAESGEDDESKEENSES